MFPQRRPILRRTRMMGDCMRPIAEGPGDGKKLEALSGELKNRSFS